MNLVLTIIAAPDGSTMAGTRHTLPSGGASIGRGGGNSLVLPDPSRITSSSHATITDQQGVYSLIDHSSNGTYLNTTDQPLDKGVPRQLQKGDSIFIGPYQIEVDFEDLASEADNLGGSFLDSLGDAGEGPIDAADSAPATSDQAEDDLDKWLSPQQPAAAPPADWPTPAELEPKPALPPVLNNDECADPMALLDGMGSSPPPNDPLQAIPAAEDSQWWLEPQPDNAPPLQQAMTPPRPVKEDVAPHVAAEPPVAKMRPAADLPAAQHLAQLMGLKSLNDEQLAELLPAASSALVLALSRLMEILRARSSIKNEIRAVRTIIGAAENNPLKFAAQVEDALAYMFSSDSKAFMRSDKAIADSFNDLEDHQLATLAGMRAAYENMLAQFSPEKLLEEMGIDAISGRLAGTKKAKAWDAFCKHYDRLSADSEAAYNRLFGEEFGRSYEDQVRQLKAMRKQRDS